jgi:nitrous oxidase accessory protein
VVIPAGTYREVITVDRPITLKGEGRPVIEGDRVTDVVTITADGVTFSGFEVRASGRDVSTEPAGIRVKGDRSVIADNHLVDVLYGIVLHGTHGHTVRHNTVESVREFDSDRRGHAIYLWYSGENQIIDNTVVAAKDGIFLSYATNSLISGNKVTNARYGIHYMYSDHNDFTNNTFTDNVAGGAIMYSEDVLLEGNEFAYHSSAGSGYGLLFRDVNDVEMRDNLIHHNRVGITMEGTPRDPGRTFEVRHNLIAYNQIGMELSTTTNVTFTENSFTGNLRQIETTGGSLEGHNTWSEGGRGNFWDDYRGYDSNGDGIGDLVYQYESLFHDMTDQNPAIRAFTFTPAQTALELAARWFPVYRPDPLVRDTHPVMRQTVSLDADGTGEALRESIPVSAALVLVPLVVVLAMRVRARRGWQAC